MRLAARSPVAPNSTKASLQTGPSVEPVSLTRLFYPVRNCVTCRRRRTTTDAFRLAGGGDLHGGGRGEVGDALQLVLGVGQTREEHLVRPRGDGDPTIEQ